MPEPITRPGTTPEFSRTIRIDRLNRREVHEFAEAATEAEMAAVADLIDAVSVAKLKINGKLEPVQSGGWRLRATVGATVVQPCVATLAPVRTRVDAPVVRLYMPGATATEAEIDLDPDMMDEVEPIPSSLDIGLIAIEEMVLALPPFPRAEGIEEVSLSTRPAGTAPIEDDKVKPFAALAALKEKMQKDGD